MGNMTSGCEIATFLLYWRSGAGHDAVEYHIYDRSPAGPPLAPPVLMGVDARGS